ncbi:2-amino-4-hydroxy-6-hydroxymethyldihydropteridine diphosphokinase [Mesobacterium sp. TK19101]|uniref:2-amino-4-hydroxy-6-hydroxymethyldihydropteridine pyrophosphokinase n=1 Tax=Mesobacterium hydrothermale TaxID=3111907 RepID=A0ABU6HM18_9RHOB|nr:2-amino-4-hydroxy-6-hydroxymethyldihydropteridine diphosphokinase [Mesobacterium sp. TK19101]MEC3862911.1 2-amino-4-hydroxy-6-hydroxymethyldihydropteridine diphosphokinase [Mesobacterium sp. TK19101]
MQFRQEILVALGANQPSWAGNSAQTLRHALGAFAAHGLRLRRISRFFATPCFPAGAGPDYVNAAVAVQSDLVAPEILGQLHRIEAAFGRERGGRWQARSIDLDLLAIGDSVLPDRTTFDRWQALPIERQRAEAPDRLILPHPRIQDRPFVLVPLADIAPDWRHPALHRTVRQMLTDLPQDDVTEVKPL